MTSENNALAFALAEPADAAEIAALRTAVAEDLTARFGRGHWSSTASERGVLAGIAKGKVLVARSDGALVATLALHTQKPWAIDPSYFAAVKRPLYLTNMAVTPAFQRRGLGRRCLAEADRLALEWPAQSIRLDAYETTGAARGAGAGDFYLHCGYREVGRVVYRDVPLRYCERLLEPGPRVS